MSGRCKVKRNWQRLLAKRVARQMQAICELQSRDEQTRVLAVHKLCPCRPGNLELFEHYLYPLRRDPSSMVRKAVNEAFNEGLERVRFRDGRASRLR
jgi:hypothetical protein